MGQAGKTVLIGGGSGMIGKALSRMLLEKGYEVIILSRSPRDTKIPGLTMAAWHPGEGEIDEEAVRKADYIINLNGANVGAKRWTRKRKQVIIDSRVDSGETLVQALQRIPNQVKAVVNASAIGYYGPDPEIPNPRPFTENDLPYSDFLGHTCRLWEQAIDPVEKLGIRLVKLRSAAVLSTRGGALKEFLFPLKFRIRPVLGNGRQITGWIHIHDICRVYIHALENESLSGAVNTVAPSVNNNRELMDHTAKSFVSGFVLPIRVPSWLLKIVFGELSIEVLKSATVSCRKLIGSGFHFDYPDLPSALDHLAANRGKV